MNREYDLRRNSENDAKAQRLIDFANNELANFCGETNKNEEPRLFHAQVRKYERKFNKYRKDIEKQIRFIDCAEDLRDFYIPFAKIPDNLFKLMKQIRWIDYNANVPLVDECSFYQSTWRCEINIRNIVTEYFITLDKYIELIHINLELKDTYLKVA